MTGYARVSQTTSKAEITIEIKSVNHRFLDMNVNLPESFAALDMAFRQILRDQLGRGRVECNLRMRWLDNSLQGLPLDNDLLAQLLTTLASITDKAPLLTACSPMDILKWPGIINPERFELATLQTDIMQCLQMAIQQLTAMRAHEGQQITVFIQQRLTAITDIANTIQAALPQLVEQQQQRLLKKFAEACLQLDPDRLAQEMVLFGQRIDIAEELSRLHMHISNVQTLLMTGGRIGRKLDFMMQELNREANTIGSKAQSADITQQVVNLKVYIEEMREQIQNIE